MRPTDNEAGTVAGGAAGRDSEPSWPARGPAGRRGGLGVGERVQLTDPKGRRHTITLAPGATFQTHRGYIRHDDLIGAPPGSVATTSGGVDYLALRPLLADHVLSMPRGAQIIYPKDAAQIVTMGDIFPGATVIEAGAGSGALSMFLLQAIGPTGQLLSVERRADFADIAGANARSWFDGDHPAWQLDVGELARVLEQRIEAGSVDRAVLDMLAPWENLPALAQVLRPGGVLTAYVATTTQLSRLAEELKDTEMFTEPTAWECMERGWHLEGLAVRPDHRMVAHTGFLLTTRRMAPGVTPPLRKRRPAKGADAHRSEEQQLAAELGPRPVSAKKLRRTRRDLERAEQLRATQATDTDEEPQPDTQDRQGPTDGTEPGEEPPARGQQ